MFLPKCQTLECTDTDKRQEKQQKLFAKSLLLYSVGQQKELRQLWQGSGYSTVAVPCRR